MKKFLRSYITILLFHFLYFLNAQNCFDADFESGTVGGYETYFGEINSTGVVIFPNKGTNPLQHQIMRIQDGFDPIANQYCTINKELLVTGNRTGKYTLRLGDASNGAKASKVILSFKVKAENSFFLLKYAVILNDPDHEYHQQPSFELYIKDENGKTLDCGEYKVRAAANIPGFESCESWRVRPWTTAGFELKSFLGKTINIEIISTDCGLGGHGGYAYIDATCTPLELELDSYCPGKGFAKYVVTDGFEKYNWSTGETDRDIEILNPIPGTEYSVTVTSATGCTLTLKDTLPTLPNLVDLKPSKFDKPDTINVCFGKEVIYQPKGININEVKAIELGYSSDIFYLFADKTKLIHFVTTDNFGCETDTTFLLLNVIDLNLDVKIKSTCPQQTNGEITINNLNDPSILTSLNFGPLTNTYKYSNLAAGSYKLTFANSMGCKFEKNIYIVPQEAPELSSLKFLPATCGLDNGSIEAVGKNGMIDFSLDGSPFSKISKWNNLKGGMYKLSYINNNGCQIDRDITIPAYKSPEVTVLKKDTIFCGKKDGRINLKTENGFPPFKYLLSSVKSSETYYITYIKDLDSGEYTVVVEDKGGCKDTTYTSIHAFPFTTIKDILLTEPSCDLSNGVIEIVPENKTLPISYYINNKLVDNVKIENLTNGRYVLKITDKNNCLDSISKTLNRIIKPSIDSIEFILQNCGSTYPTLKLKTTSHNDSITYFINDKLSPNLSNTVLYPGKNKLAIMDDHDCYIDTTIVTYDYDLLTLPNIFSPASNNSNSEFCIKNEFIVNQLTDFFVFDRWGNKVFSKEIYQNINTCWDGKYNGKYVEEGVYIYQIKARLVDGRLFCKTGDITVVR